MVSFKNIWMRERGQKLVRRQGLMLIFEVYRLEKGWKSEADVRVKFNGNVYEPMHEEMVETEGKRHS